jgi:hypothetical protein
LFALAAQASDSVILHGRVTHGSNPVSGAVVLLYNVDEAGSSYNSQIATKTELDGAYNFSNLKPGMYIIIVTLDGERLYQGEIPLSGDEPEVNKDIEL